MPISLPISSVTAGGRNGLGLPSQPCVAPETAGFGDLGDRCVGECLRRIEAVSTVADQELGACGQDRAADPDEHAVRALEVGHDPPVQSADGLERDLDVPR
ncbi:MAG: hypothetical protein ABSE84_20690 [Isosphaeraceae bacterium]